MVIYQSLVQYSETQSTRWPIGIYCHTYSKIASVVYIAYPHTTVPPPCPSISEPDSPHNCTFQECKQSNLLSNHFLLYAALELAKGWRSSGVRKRTLALSLDGTPLPLRFPTPFLPLMSWSVKVGLMTLAWRLRMSSQNSSELSRTWGGPTPVSNKKGRLLPVMWSSEWNREISSSIRILDWAHLFTIKVIWGSSSEGEQWTGKVLSCTLSFVRHYSIVLYWFLG